MLGFLTNQPQRIIVRFRGIVIITMVLLVSVVYRNQLPLDVRFWIYVLGLFYAGYSFTLLRGRRFGRGIYVPPHWGFLVIDIAFITGFLYFTGGIASPLFPAYFVIIVATATFRSVEGSLAFAILASTAYGLLFLVGTPIHGVRFTPGSVMITQVAFLLLVALVTNALAGMYRTVRERSREKSKLITELEATKEKLATSYKETQRYLGEMEEKNVQLDRINRELVALYEASCAVSSTLELDDLLKLVLNQVHATIPAVESSSVAFLDDDGVFRVRVAKGLSEELVRRFEFRKDEGMLGFMVTHREPVLMVDTMSDADAREAGNGEPDLRIKSTMCAPFVVKEGVIGAIIAHNLRESHAFTRDDLRLLSTLANVAASGVENARLYARTKELAITDGITQVYNHRHFREVLSTEFNRSLITQRPLGLIMFDIDQFKNFNDTFGHIAGDRALLEVARIIRTCVREGDVVARYGGEEFVVVLPGVTRDGALAIAERIRSAVENQTLFQEEDLPSCVTVSGGIAAYPEDAKTSRDLVQRADQALYLAKRSGRNSVRVFSSQL